MSLLNIFTSELIKTRRTALRLIVTIVPIVYPAFMLWYFSKYNRTSLLQIKIYSAFFEVISVALPMVAALLSGLTVLQEEETGNFNGFLAEPISRTKLYVSKLSLLILFTAIDVLLASFLMLLGMKFILHVENIQYGLFLQGSIWSVIGSLILYAIHLLISFAYGMGPSIAIGGAGFLISAIVGATVVGDNIWQYVPWAWAIRLSKNPVLLMPSVKTVNGMLASEVFVREMMKGLIPAVLGFLIVTILGILWFNRWDGRSSYE